MDEVEMAHFDVACHTGGCENERITIRVLADAENPTVMCGACSTIITDVTPV
jgi:hypothetical protein